MVAYYALAANVLRPYFEDLAEASPFASPSEGLATGEDSSEFPWIVTTSSACSSTSSTARSSGGLTSSTPSPAASARRPPGSTADVTGEVPPDAPLMNPPAGVGHKLPSAVQKVLVGSGCVATIRERHNYESTRG